MSLDISSLENAIISLENAVNVFKIYEDATDTSEALINTLRAGVIQCFEFTFELCWKMMKRWLDENISPTTTFGITKKELYRLAAENALITEVDKWFIFQSARNKTSHTYDELVAVDVLCEAQKFLPYAKDFYERLEKRI